MKANNVYDHPNRDAPPTMFLPKPLANDGDAEKAALGMCFVDNELFELIKDYDPNIFYSPHNRTIFAGMKSASDKGLVLDPITIAAQIENVQSIGGVAAIAKLQLGIPPISKKAAESWLGGLRETFAEREIIRICNELVYKVQEREGTIKEMLSEAETSMSAVEAIINHGKSARPSIGFRSIAELRPEIEAKIINYSTQQRGEIPTGLKELDKQLEGDSLQPKGLYYIAAPPKLGKSALVHGWADFISEERLVLIASAEMSELQTAMRMYSKKVGVPNYHFRPGMRGESLTKALEGLDGLTNQRLKITDNMFDLATLRTHCLKEQDKAENLLGAVIVDYMQLFSIAAVVRSGNEDNRATEVAKVSRALKFLAMEMHVPVIAISTLTNEAMKGNPVPTFTGLKESGNLAYDAEVVIALHNPNFVPGTQYDKPQVEDINLHILLNRGGTTNTIPLKFIPKFMSFYSEEEFKARMNQDIVEAKQEDIKEDLELWQKPESVKTFDLNRPKSFDLDDF